MKKAVKIALPLLLIAIIFSTQTIKGDYLVTVNSVFDYDVVDSAANVTFGTNNANIQGYEINGQYFNPGNTISLNVTDVQPTSTTYNLTSGSYSEIRSTGVLDVLYMIILMIYPVALIEHLSVSTWNETALEEDYHAGILMVPFLSVYETTWNDWIETVNDINANGTIMAETFTEALVVEAAYHNTTTNFVFEFYLSGTLNEQYTHLSTTSLINVTIEHQYQFAYTKATGVMLGMRMEGTISGLSNGTIVEVNYDYRAEQTGYDLPSYQLGGPTWPFPGFEYLIALGALGTLTTIMVLVRRRK